MGRALREKEVTQVSLEESVRRELALECDARQRDEGRQLREGEGDFEERVRERGCAGEVAADLHDEAKKG